MKKSLILVGMLAVGYANAQVTDPYEGKVGVNVQEPKATLDVAAYKTDGSTTEGLLIPRLAKEAVVKMTNPEVSTLVYVTDEVLESDNAKFQGIGKGFYFYNGTKWVKQLDTDTNSFENLYNTDGTLTSHRIVDMDGKRLTFQNLKGNTNAVLLNTAADTYAKIGFQQEGNLRWDIGKTNNKEEGNDFGSDFYITSYNDANVSTRRMTIKRETGNVGIGTTSPIAKLDVGPASAQIAGRYFHRTTTSESIAPNVKSIITVRDIITDSQGIISDDGKKLEQNRTYEIVLNSYGTTYNTGSKYIVYFDNVKQEWISKLVSSADKDASVKLGIAPSGNEIEIWHEHPANTYILRANVVSINNYSSSGTSAYNFGLDGAMTNLAGNVGVGTEAPTEKLDVDGNIKATSLAGTGNRNVYADEKGVLRVGEATSTGATTVGSTDGIVCNADNVGKINYGDITLSDGRTVGAFGFCMKGADASNNPTYGWKYLYGIQGVTSGSGAFGSGIR